MSEQASKFGRGNDRDVAIVRGVEILIAGYEVLGGRKGREQIEKRAIAFIANRNGCGIGTHQIGVQAKISQHRLGCDRGVHEVPADRWALEHLLEFRERGVTHDGDDLSGSDGVEDTGRGTGQRHQP